ncbi:hypothetical protein INT44_006637 [Umbelopsis vinacea]|uniref:Uncharacterized protein n=1 Tax=Umbelopsis vinacea TaxID=44442 RepID=A0A8H7UAF4_9FUNG|nr:hypothetical protein INT44_006637 [Umbelopsis vinacea]
MLYCSSLLLFSGRTFNSTGEAASDEALKVVALAEEKDHEVVIDVNTSPTQGSKTGYEWDAYIAPHGVDSNNQDVDPELDVDNEQSSEDKLATSSDDDQDIPSSKLPENNSDLNASEEDNPAAPAEINDKEEATNEYDEEKVIEFGDSSIDGETKDETKKGEEYANSPSEEEALKNPSDSMPLEFDNNLWEANPRQLSLETVAAYPTNKKKPSPYIKDYADLSAETHNSSHLVCKGNKCEERANAVIVVLCRNSELVPMRRTLREFEDRFNRKYQYPYVFLNDEPFNDEFKTSIKALTHSKVIFGDINEEMWSYPDFVNQSVAANQLKDYDARGVMYGTTARNVEVSAIGICADSTLAFFTITLWFSHTNIIGKRVEPGVHFYCDLDYDPFLYMQKNGKQYGFNIALQEIPETIPTLWDHTMNFAHLNQLNTTLLRFFGNPKDGYNLCHFWSNFEIANLNLWRRPEYQAYFHYLDSTGNFFYERWGDAIVHSLAAGMFLNKSEVHFFDDIGYKHDSFSHCTDDGIHGKCMCPEDTPNFDFMWGSCFSDWHIYPESGKTWNFLGDGRQQLNKVVMAGHRGLSHSMQPKSKKPAASTSSKTSQS